MSIFAASSSFAQSQKNEIDDVDSIQLELDKAISKRQQPSANLPSDDSTKDNTLKDFKGLGELAPFSEISVIQKKYNPKTGRLMLSAGLLAVTNDPFFNTFGAAFKGAYFFTETWGVEASYYALTSSEAQSTT
jgi:hypothetical protein